MSPAKSISDISDRKLEANRANAEKSSGPRTDEGKAKSRNNAWRHGLTAQVACMPWEDRKAFDEFCGRIASALQPEGEIEIQFANTIAEDYWRVNRIRNIENNIFALETETAPQREGELETALAQASAFVENAPAFGIISLYESRISRKISKNEQALRVLQTERRAAYEKALEEALLLAELAIEKGEVYDPALDNSRLVSAHERSGLIPTESSRRETSLVSGFVFSAAQLHHLIDRRRRLNEARALFQTARNRKSAPRKAA